MDGRDVFHLQAGMYWIDKVKLLVTLLKRQELEVAFKVRFL